MTASVTHGRALRYADGSARGLLHHHPGHCPLKLQQRNLMLCPRWAQERERYVLAWSYPVNTAVK